ncbi:molybdate ABC transporter substrate-binding protein [Vibrio hannami]|uniref:molybdate ABC transporter substrate-binding protein n=1 Tax=Vibrio hannami TaxID=2717094 RepID=UPI00240ED33C|nr:molybdate ABC transporter substrate-binding protein [Vibrio hannami]MDG3085021.1 molybdate ABC transporter substrate-binding protein [Vibrio hannami]
MKRFSLFCMFFLLGAFQASATEVRVAVANNFYGPLKELARDYQQQSGDSVVISTGSTGQLYAQIINGAPFDIFLSADAARPAKLVEAGLASEPFTYALGRLVLWSSDSQLLKKGAASLTINNFKHLALANPKLAPYGYASVQVMEKAGVYSELKSTLVEGKNLSVVYQFVVTGNAQAGFLAMSQIYKDSEFIDGSYWIIPEQMYDPIRQNAVLLKSAQNKNASNSFIEYLKSERARKIIVDFGYL